MEPHRGPWRRNSLQPDPFEPTSFIRPMALHEQSRAGRIRKRKQYWISAETSSRMLPCCYPAVLHWERFERQRCLARKQNLTVCLGSQPTFDAGGTKVRFGPEVTKALAGGKRPSVALGMNVCRADGVYIWSGRKNDRFANSCSIRTLARAPSNCLLRVFDSLARQCALDDRIH